MKNWIKIFFLATVITLVLVGYGWHIYKKKPADTRKQVAEIEMKARDLITSFQQDEGAASQKYIDKILVVSGEVADVQISPTGQATLILDAGDPLSSIVCSFYAEETLIVKKIKSGMQVRVKGKCTGILLDVILNKCSMVE